MAQAAPQKADANPTKEFFVRMITRDITLEDCILDLIDNSVDGAWRSEGSRPIGLAADADLSQYAIVIDADSERFRITDNCGGMTLDDAANHAFSFGRKASEDHDNYSIGVYGIGMKRAVFKLGATIRIRSTYKDTKGKRHAFAVPINVDEWLADDAPPWDFDIDEDEGLDQSGVEITVTALNPGTASAFGNAAFLQNLQRTIARDYSLHLNRGLKIVLNGKTIKGWRIELLESDQFNPMRVEYADQSDGHEVSVEIIGGMAAPPPENTDPDEDDEGDKRYGWYVVCNGRIVLAADKTTVTGWGSDELDWPQWHRQYSGFIGIVLFTAADATALPLTTTKRSVDTSSDVFRRARRRMKDVTRKWISYTNERKQSLEQAKAREAEAKPISIYDVHKQETLLVPTLVARKDTERVGHVSYSVPLRRLRRLAEQLGRKNMPHREVGIRSFDYTFKDMVGDE